jgi:hypothetical protein
MQGGSAMRTTLSLDDDVLLAAKAIAGQQGRSLGEVVSDLARRSLQRPVAQTERNGIPLLASRQDAPPVTMDIVNALRDEPS